MNELKLFLEQNPHLKSYQARLDREMNDVPDQFRMMVLCKHILNNIDELETELRLLEATVKKGLK